jgi:ferredoxin
MAIPTSRTKEKAKISIDEKICTGCGLCVEVCKDFSFVLRDGKAALSDNPVFGCIGCGHCMAICPVKAIHINGRCISPEDIFSLPDKKDVASYNAFFNLLRKRRSIREFKEVGVEKEIIDKVLEAAKTAPMGLPPSDVHVLVLDSKETVRKFAQDFCKHLEGMKWLVSKWFLTLMRPFWGKENDEFFREFVRPCFNVYLENIKKGVNVVNYDAPAAMYFYGSSYCDPADPIIAATYAMLAAESLGLGTCMLGAIHPLIQYGKSARRLREKYGIKYKSREGIFVIMGYPRIKYQQGIRRTFASVETHGIK